MLAVRRAAQALLVLLLVTAPALPARAAAPPPTQANGSSSLTAPAAECPDRSATEPDHAPVLAHFYQWFTSSSWLRAKKDYPVAGRYSSDDVRVMRSQVGQAKSAGIGGFIVSWKSTTTLDYRLAQLRDVAATADFRLAVTYQAQDFDRKPLPPDRIRKDLEWFAATYGDDPVFRVLGQRPVVALSGTWNYSAAQLQSITRPVASRLLVLATEKSVAGYQRVAGAVEGDLYYWSSADPLQTRGYAAKLMDMANAVRQRCGVWVAPVSPGFDARDVGGTSVVQRRDGETLRRSWEAALATTPDAVGVISWNEFSENTFVEPSEQYGNRYLQVLSQLAGAAPIPPLELDSSDPQGGGSPLRAAVAGGAGVTFLSLVTIFGLRRRRRALSP